MRIPYMLQSKSIMLAGESEAGKTHQIQEAFDVAITLDDGEVFYPFRPALYLATGGDRFSAAGTASEMITHPDCTFIRAGSVDEAIAALRQAVKDGHQDGRPYRMVVHDSWSSFRDQAAHEVRERAVSEAQGGKGLRDQARKNIANNPKDIHSFAFGDIAALVQAFYECGRGPIARLMISTCHTKERFIDAKTLALPGQELILSEVIRRQVHSGQNVVWHMFRQDPDYASRRLHEVNSVAAEPQFYAITKRGNYPAPIGHIWYAKCQGEGDMEIFRHCPTVYESPSLGYCLAYMLATQHGLPLPTPPAEE